jgi:hypothetical protein
MRITIANMIGESMLRLNMLCQWQSRRRFLQDPHGVTYQKTAFYINLRRKTQITGEDDRNSRMFEVSVTAISIVVFVLQTLCRK